MEDNTRELISQLFTRIGMIMEDASPAALLAGSGDCATQEHAVDAIEQATEQITALTSAIRALFDE